MNWIIKFDPFNKQEDYQYIARDITSGELEVGYLAIEKPWFSPENSWRYWLIKNSYGEGGFCGGKTDLGFTKVEIDKNTIKPFTQIAFIEKALASGISVKLVRDASLDRPETKENLVAFIDVGDSIPYYLWN